MPTSSKRIYAIHHAFQVCCSQRPCQQGRSLLTHATTGDTQTLKDRPGSVSCGLSLLPSLCPGTHQVLFTPSEYLWWAWNFILNVIASLLPSYWGFSFAPGCEVCFLVGPNILLLMVFSSCLWFWCFHRRIWAHFLLLCHLKSSLWEMLMDGKN